MAGTFSQIYIQVVFAVKGKENLLPWRDEVFKYMSGIVKNKGQKPIIVNGVTDHVHLFIGLKPAIALSDLVRDVKFQVSLKIRLLTLPTSLTLSSTTKNWWKETLIQINGMPRMRRLV
jgi:REP element-mobilizing transposase RayT